MGRLQLLVLVVAILCCLNLAAGCGEPTPTEGQHYWAISCRKHTAFLPDFGGKGDGKTSNTNAFKAAIAYISKLASDGGGQLIVPPGKWADGVISLDVAFHTFLTSGCYSSCISESDYPVVDPLPSYGRGIDVPGKRYAALITGTNLTDTVVTGKNGTIDGQGKIWWDKLNARKLKYSRPMLIEITHSNMIQVSDLTLINSPSWNVHPVYCRDVIVENLTILAPTQAPNTDGINPDSCENVRIRGCYIESSDDCIAIKSGRDQVGVKAGRPSQHISISRVLCLSPRGAAIALGSEMSGGIEDVRADEIKVINAESGVRLKTGNLGGGCTKDIYVKNMFLSNLKYVFWLTGNYSSHPNGRYGHRPVPRVQNINFLDFLAENVTLAGKLQGIHGDPFTGICISDTSIRMGLDSSGKRMKIPWKCTDISGTSSRVFPKACHLLVEKTAQCNFPRDVLSIDRVELKSCSAALKPW